MRFTLSSTALSSRLQTLARVINSKNSLPILDSFLFEVHDQQIFITASDSENVMKSSLALDECDGEGSFAVPNRTLLDAVKELANSFTASSKVRLGTAKLPSPSHSSRASEDFITFSLSLAVMKICWSCTSKRKLSRMGREFLLLMTLAKV